MTKPFSLEELIARLRNILRRTGAVAEHSSRLRFADLELDEDTREVTRGTHPIELTATEYRLLRYLLLNPQRHHHRRVTAALGGGSGRPRRPEKSHKLFS